MVVVEVKGKEHYSFVSLRTCDRCWNQGIQSYINRIKKASDAELASIGIE